METYRSQANSRYKACISIFQEIQLEWIISRSISNSKSRPVINAAYCGISVNMTLQYQLEIFWKIEDMNQEIHRSSEERLCEEHFCSTYSKDEEGSFILHLPLKGKMEDLRDSYKNAEKHL